MATIILETPNSHPTQPAMKSYALLFLLALTSFFTPSQDDSPAPKPVVEAELGEAVNVHRSGDLWFSGQFTEKDIALLKERGIRRVISTRTEGEVPWNEPEALEKAGIEFVMVPFRQPDSLTIDVFGEIRELLADSSVPTLFHCGSANRVGGAWLPFRVLDQGVPLEQAITEAKTIGLRTDAYKVRAIAYIEQERASGVGREPSVKKGINDSFKAPELDVENFLSRFEVESREVFAARHEILKALELKPGMRVADIGAGTGLYTFLLSESVGYDGWVYAVDIAPGFLDHIRGIAAARKVGNISPVLCQEDAVGLPPESIDLAYVCDTYHHFEYPLSTTRTIHRALKPGGRFVVVDFERIPGESREWILDHVRAGKDESRAEIEQAGFEFVREIKVEGLAENYFIEFKKVGK